MRKSVSGKYPWMKEYENCCQVQAVWHKVQKEFFISGSFQKPTFLDMKGQEPSAERYQTSYVASYKPELENETQP